MALKGRPKRPLLSALSIITPEIVNLCNFIIVEDSSDNILKFDTEETNERRDFLRDHIKHYLVQTNLGWTKAILLNYGIKKIITPYFIMWDADVLFPENFVSQLHDFMTHVDSDKYLITINSYETESSDVGPALTPYGSLWIYKTEHVQGIKGFNESYVGFGMEDRDLEYRLQTRFNLKTIYTYYVNPSIFVLHLSHNHNLRHKYMKRTIDNKNLYTETVRMKRIVPNDSWGEI